MYIFIYRYRSVVDCGGVGRSSRVGVSGSSKVGAQLFAASGGSVGRLRYGTVSYQLWGIGWSSEAVGRSVVEDGYLNCKHNMYELQIVI